MTEIESWEAMIQGPSNVLTKHSNGCGRCRDGFWCEERRVLLGMQDAKVLAWQEAAFARQGWEIMFR